MIKQLIIVNRLPNLSKAEFLNHWRNTHAPLIASVSAAVGIRRYVQLSPLSDGSPLSKASNLECDGIAEVWFDSVASVLSGAASSEAKAAMKRIREDEERFIDRSRTQVIWGEEAQVI
ncbi:MAG: EthD domain-containing protein [Pseudomonadota bacterium]